MSRPMPRLKELEARKQLLVAESELRRIETVRACVDLRENVTELAAQARLLGSLVSAASCLIAATFAIHRSKSARPEKPSWISRLIQGLRLGLSVWMAARRSRPESQSAGDP
jgi:hypothetical protein